MGLPAKKNATSPTHRRNRLARGKDVLLQAANSIRSVAESLEEDFLVAVDKILATRGSVIVCGIGKAGIVGRKISATFASTGTRSHFLHPAEAIHGDLGCIGPSDLILVLSNSGATQEIIRLLPIFSRRAAGIVAITGGGNSPLARAADIALVLPPCREACLHNLAPSTSTTSMLALGDALALVVSEARGFTMDDFAELHPGGALGKRLSTVEDAMRPVNECRIASAHQTVREMLVEVARPGRRTGAVMLVDSAGKLAGIFTDSDLAKIMEQRRDSELDSPVGERMSKSFSAIQQGARLTDAIDVMVARKISELPVVDQEDHPIGLIDITDVLEIEHHRQASTSKSSQSLSSPVASNHSIHSEEASGADADDAGDEDGWDEGPTTLRIFGPRR